MRHQQFRRTKFVMVLALLLALGAGGVAVADGQASSPSYSVNEVQIGGNGSTQSVCSDGGQYCASESVGDIVNGGSSSGSYSAQFGADTTDEPLLEVIVDGGIQNLGVLQTDSTGTASFGLKVRSYLSDGYIVQVTGAPPKNGSYSLKTMDPNNGASPQCPCTSQPGAEQFGINLAANTAPSVGATLAQVPSSDFSFGDVARGPAVNGGYLNGGSGNDIGDHDYSAPNFFAYKDGDVVAGSNRSTGETDYTISMIINISGVTPGGKYTGLYSAVVTPMF